MTWTTVLLALVLGGALAPFASMLTERVPAGAALRPRPHCRSCADTLPWRDQVPLLSWMLLRGRCRHCGAAIGWRTPVIEALCMVATWVALAQPWSLLVTAAWVLFVPVGVALAFIDLAHKRLPNLLTLRAAAALAVVLGLDAALHGWAPWLRALLAAAVLFGAYLLMNLLTRGGMGMGDVKLALSIGLLAGYLGWLEVAIASAAAFLVAGAVSALLLLTRRATRRSTIPFGPFMLIGLLLAAIGADVARQALLL